MYPDCDITWISSLIWAALCENMSSGICGQQRPRSAQADQGLRCPPTESFDIAEYINDEQMPGLDFAHARNES